VVAAVFQITILFEAFTEAPFPIAVAFDKFHAVAFAPFQIKVLKAQVVFANHA
jgi:hypothetical protein